MAYICQFKPKLGALNLGKCIEKGITAGPILGTLKNGEDVILPNGDTVYAVDVRDPDDPGQVIIVIDIPSKEFLGNLENDALFGEYYSLEENNRLDIVLHFTPKEIADTKEYQRFVKKFPPATKHWFLNENNK